MHITQTPHVRTAPRAKTPNHFGEQERTMYQEEWTTVNSHNPVAIICYLVGMRDLYALPRDLYIFLILLHTLEEYSCILPHLVFHGNRLAILPTNGVR